MSRLYVVSILLLILCNLFFLAYSFGHRGGTNEGLSGSYQEQMLSYGDPVPAVVAGLLKNSVRIESASRHTNVILYAGTDLPWQKLRYSSILLERYATHGQGLGMLLVVGKIFRDRRTELAEKLGYPVVVDNHGEIRDALRVLPGTDGTFIVDSGGAIQLVVPMLIKRDELRQHVEKHVLGEIFYERTPMTYLGPSEKMPQYPVVRIGDGEELSFSPPAGSTVAVFTAAACAVCSTRSYFDDLERLEYVVKSEPGFRGEKLKLLLSASYPLLETLMEVEERQLDVEVYQATATLTGLEDDYFTKRRDDAALLVLTIEDGNAVSDLRSLSKFLEDQHHEI